MSLAIIGQVLVSTVYWTTLHREMVKRNTKHPGRLVYGYLCHSLPAIACFYNVAVTDFIFYRRFVRVALFMCYLYLGVNYATT